MISSCLTFAMVREIFMKIEIENKEFVEYVKTHGGVISIGNYYQVVG